MALEQELYHLADIDDVLQKKDMRGVAPWSHGFLFHCPCGKRAVYVNETVHTVTFNGIVMHVNPSIGNPVSDPHRPKNWCHFFIKEGEPRMCGDARCPGKDL